MRLFVVLLVLMLLVPSAYAQRKQERGYNVYLWGATGNGTTDDRVAISRVDDWAAAESLPLYFPPNTYLISDDLTIAANCEFESGASLSIDAGQNVTFSGKITAPQEQIFSGSGSVSLSVQAIVHAAWWGGGNFVGFSTTGPDRRVDILDDSDPQLRLSQADGSKYTDFQVDSNGDITVTPSGDEFILPGGKTLVLPNAGLHLLDTDATHDLIVSPGSNLTADKTLTLTTGDSDRTVTLSGNPTLADWFDQAVKAASSPSFAALTVSGTITSKVGRTATLVVAANDSSAIGIAQADYVCDGTADDVQIQAAIDALSVDGGKIQLLEGKYNISDTVIVNKGIMMTGTGSGYQSAGGSELYLVDGADCDMIKLQPRADNGASFALPVFENMCLRGNEANQGVDTSAIVQEAGSGVDIAFRNIWFDDWNGPCIILTQYWDHIIDRCIFEHGTNYCLYLDPADGDSITGVWFTRCWILAQSCVIGSGGTGRLENISIADNLIDVGSASNPDMIAVKELDGKLRIFNNTILCGGNTNVIVVDNTAQAPEDIMIAHNQVSCSLGNIITFSGNQDIARVSIQDNILQGGARDIIYSSTGALGRILISGNMFDNYSAQSFRQSSGAGAISDISILGNQYWCGVGSAWALYNEGTINRALVSGNHLTGYGSGAQGGYYFYSTHTYVSVIGNYFDETYCAADGVKWTGASKPHVVKYNTGFLTENSGTAIIANGQTAIVVTHGLDITPSINDISVTPTNSMGNATKYYVSNVGASTFNINVDGDPGVTTATFVWQIGSY